MMTPNEVWKKIEAEIAGDWDRPNHHGVDLVKCVVRTPVLKEYHELVPAAHTTDLQGRQVVSHWEERPRRLWLILEEHPDTKRGYEIVYDEQGNEFGLALGDAVIGFYGSFLETLQAM